MKTTDLEALAWHVSRLPVAVSALAAECGVARDAPSVDGHTHSDDVTDAGAAIEWFAQRLGCEALRVDTTFRDLEGELATALPAVLRLSESRFLAICGRRGERVEILTPAGERRRIRIAEICAVVREPAERPLRAEFEQLMSEGRLPERQRGEALSALLQEQLGDRRFDECWMLRSAPGGNIIDELRDSGAVRNGSGLLVAHTAQYLLWLASWAILGRLSFDGRMDRGWLAAWALLLMTLIPFRVLTTWLQGSLAIGVGAFLKRRLLVGAMRLAPEEVRHGGIGTFLGQALEAEAVETLALSGGLASLLAVIELAVSGFVLGRFSLVLLVWFCGTGALAYRFMRRYQTWTDTRMEMTQDLVDSMVGHRTRLAQQNRDEWHEGEDAALFQYLGSSTAIDNTGAWLVAAIPRGWLLAGLGCLVPAIVAGKSSSTETAVVLGGVLLAYTAFRRLTGSITEIAAAWVAAKRVAPLVNAAGRPQILGQFPSAMPKPRAGDEKLIEAERLSYRYRAHGPAAVKGCSLVIRKGERILLEGSSGGGKTTLASLLCGMREPESGLLLIGGLDRYTLGLEGWRKRIASAPQFHENHILTETLAFNLLMGRRWPPTQKDMQEGETLCRDLGLGELLDRMPSGLQQMVGEGGWQLSHGERSRIFMARALLQDAEMIILDESFAALDPENLSVAMECTLQRASTLMVIAHP